MALVKGSDTLSTGLGVGSNLGQELKEQRERGQAVSEINKQLVESGTSFDPKTQAINVQGYQEQKRKYDNYVKELDNYNKNLAINGVEGAVEQIVPKVSISNGAVKFTGTESALKSDVANKMREKLSVDLKGVDINSPDVALAVQSMTQETEKAIREQVVRDGLGWEPENYDRYKYAVQTMQSTTPMKSSNLIEARDKDGKIVKKTPQQWVDYWMNNYDSDSRRDMFLNGARVYKEGGDGLDAIPYVIMSAGMQSDNAAYGFNAGDAWRALVRGAGAEYGKLGQNIVNTIQDTTEGLGSVKQRLKSLGAEDALGKELEVISPQEFIGITNRLKSGLVSEGMLTDKEKQVLALGSSGGSGWMQGAFGQDKQLDVGNVAETVDYNTYANKANDWNRQVQMNDNFYRNTEEQVQKDASVYAEAATTAGRFAGILGRFAAEALTIKGLTGVNIMGLGERIASKVWSGAKGAEFLANSMPIAQATGKVVVAATSALPENLVQLAVDNIATGRVAADGSVMTPEEAIEDTVSAFIVSLVLVGGKSAISAAVNSGARRAAEAAAKYNVKIDADDIVRASRQAQDAIDNDRVEGINNDGYLEYTDASGETVVFDKAPAVEIFSNTDNAKLKQMIDDYAADSPFKGLEYDETKDIIYRTEPVVEQIDTIKEVLPGNKATKTGAEQMSLAVVVDDAARIDPRTGVAHINGEVTNAIPPSLAKEIKLRRSTILNTDTASTLPSSKSLKWGDTRPLRFSSVEDALSSKPTVGSAYDTRAWVAAGADAATNELDLFMKTDFANKFPRYYNDQIKMIREWDAMNWLVRNGVKESDVVGKSVYDEASGETIKITKQTKASYEYFDKNFLTPQGLRLASREALGLEGDFNQLGYLPHSYINSNQSSFEEAMTAGALWRRNTGATTTADNGNFTSMNMTDSLNERYNILATNLLSDTVADQSALAKFMEELHAEGIDVDAKTAYNTVKKVADTNKKLADTPTAKEFTKELTDINAKSDRLEDLKNARDGVEKDAKKLGLARAINENYKGVYNGGRVEAGKIIIFADMQTNAHRLRTTRGTLYDNGYRMITAHDADARAIVDSYLSNGDLRGTIIDYLERFSNRSDKGVEYVADRWMEEVRSLVDDAGEINVMDIEMMLSQKVRFEAMTMLNRWLSVRNFDDFSPSAQKFLNEFMYQNSVINQTLKHPLIQSKLNQAADVIVRNRYRSLFYGNFRNALLQLSESIRVVENYGFSNTLKILGRLATEADFAKKVDDLQTRFDTFSNQSSTSRFTDMHKYDEAAFNTAKGLKQTETIMDFKKVKGGFEDFMEKADEIGTAPINLAESQKNRLFIAAALDSAEKQGLTDFALYEKVMEDFNRLSLAANEFGRMAYANNAFARMGLFLQNFNIRFVKLLGTEVKDHFKNEGAVAAAKYITKFLGSRVGLWFIMSKLGYSLITVSGLDPFGMLDKEYTGLSQDEMTGFDAFMTKNPLFAGGITSLISDGYFAMRQAYSQSKGTPAEEAAKSEFGLNPQGLVPEDFFDAIGVLFPGYNLYNRTVKMNDLMDKGLAASKKGTLMYESPDNWMDVARGYLFGRSSTPNAMDYSRVADPLSGIAHGGLAGLGREFGREFGQFGQFDPIDTQNYSDWFNGTWQDNQRWMSGIYYFRNKRDEILDRYDKTADTFSTDQEQDEWQNQMNNELNDLYGQMRRFANAYEKANPAGITPNMMSQLLYTMNNFQYDARQTRKENEDASTDEYYRSLNRYTQTGLPVVGRLQGPTNLDPNREITYQESPQYRNAVSGKYGVPEQAAKDIERLYKEVWKELRKQYADRAYAEKSYSKRESIQREYIAKVRQELDPIVREYGTVIFSNDKVGDVIEDVFSGMIPYKDFGRNKRGRYQSMPYATADYKKILQNNYYKNYPTSGTVQYTESSREALSKIKDRLDDGKRAEAKTLARNLLERVRNNTAAVSAEQLKWLQGVLNG